MTPPLAKPTPALALEHITYMAAHTTIIDDVTLSIAPGEIVCLLGPSGCGKTTLLRIAAGLERPTAGFVHLGERLVAGPTAFEAPERRGVGLMFQDYALFPHLTVLQNVMFGLSGPPDHARNLAMEALSRSGLSPHAADYPHMLSGGEQQRVALARALVPNPTVLLMDEPFSNLDQRMREVIRDETIALVRQSATTTVVVTHDPVEAMSIADRIILLNRGRLEQCGAPEQIYLRPRTLFAARFMCEVNEIPAACHDEVVDCALGRFAAPGVPDGEAIVCLRPQALEIVSAEQDQTAVVTDARFLGDSIRVTASIEGIEQPLHISIPALRLRYRTGQRIGLRIDREAALVFSAHPVEAEHNPVDS